MNEPPKDICQDDKSIAIDFLIADLEHFGESFWRSERIGESRFKFFITLVTAVITGLVALHTSDKYKCEQLLVPKNDLLALLFTSDKYKCEQLLLITNVALFGLLIFGFLTYLRMLRRNLITDKYKYALKQIREKVRSISPLLQLYQPLSKKDNEKSLKKKSAETDDDDGGFFKGGLAETVAAIEAFLFFILLVRNSFPIVVSAILGVILCVSLIVISVKYRKEKKPQ